MYKDIRIGNIPDDTIISAIVYNEYPKVRDFISDNSILYWCSEELSGDTIYIAKSSLEGKKLTKLLEEKTDVEKIKNFLIDIVLKNMKPEDFVILLKNEYRKGYEQGRKDTRYHIQEGKI